MIVLRIGAQVVGIELCEPAVLDARANALLNEVTNARFIAAPAESVLHTCTTSISGEAIAVVDPPRGGLHPVRACLPSRTVCPCVPKFWTHLTKVLEFL